MVEEVGGEVTRVKPGDRVATTQRYHVCGVCRFCRGGLRAALRATALPRRPGPGRRLRRVRRGGGRQRRARAGRRSPTRRPRSRHARSAPRSTRSAMSAGSRSAIACWSPAPAAAWACTPCSSRGSPAPTSSRRPRRRTRRRCSSRSARTWRSSPRAARISRERVRTLTEGEGVDAVIDNVGTVSVRRHAPQPRRERPLDPGGPAHRRLRAVQSGAAVPAQPVDAVGAQHARARSSRIASRSSRAATLSRWSRACMPCPRSGRSHERVERGGVPVASSCAGSVRPCAAPHLDPSSRTCLQALYTGLIVGCIYG